jgi:uncharacterized membrane protein
MKINSFVDRFFEYLLTITAAVSFVVNLSYLFISQKQFFSCFLQMVLVSMIILFFISYKKVFKIAILLIFILFAVYIGYLQLSSGAVLNYINSVANSGGLVRQSANVISNAVIAAGVSCTALLFFAAKNRFTLLLVSVAGLGEVFVQSFLKYNYYFSVLLIYIGCCAALYLRRYMLGRERKKQIKGVNRAGFAAAAIILCAAAVIGSQFLYAYFSSIFINTNEIDYSRLLSQIQDDIFPPISKSGFGDYNPDRKLGQPVALDYTPVLEVKADGPFYLVGRTYDDYTGSGWKVSPLPNKNIMENYTYFTCAYFADRNALNSLKKANSEPKAIKIISSMKNPLFSVKTLNITVKTNGLNYIFMPEGTLNYQNNYNNQGIQLVHIYPDYITMRPLSAGTQYSAEYIDCNTSSNEFINSEQNFSDSYNKLMSDPNWTAEASSIKSIVQNADAFYSNPGSTVTARTKKLALSITKNCTNEFEKADAIKSWLDAHCKYTLIPPQPPQGEDFVDFFLSRLTHGCSIIPTCWALLRQTRPRPERFRHLCRLPQR